jgi:hypothetical protein
MSIIKTIQKTKIQLIKRLEHLYPKETMDTKIVDIIPQFLSGTRKYSRFSGFHGPVFSLKYKTNLPVIYENRSADVFFFWVENSCIIIIITTRENN